jgi:hypothetical protein
MLVRKKRSIKRARKIKGEFRWANYSDKKLLDTRLCDLGLEISGTWLEKPVAQIYSEMQRRGLRLRPHFWLSEEFFCPERNTGIAIPFYLAHPRLKRLERKEMLAVEGGNLAWCMMLLRHETGHAMQHGFALHRRKKWQYYFGNSSQEYPELYKPKPSSKDYVLHLDAWYAQSHPDEDFAETFAVWFKSHQRWRKRYEGWFAYEKLNYVDKLMGELKGRAPGIRTKARVDPLSQCEKTLREYYDEKRERFGMTFPDIYDRDLIRIFVAGGDQRTGETAAAFLRRNRATLRKMVARWTGEYEFTLDQVFKDMIGRCQELKLRALGDEKALRLDFAILLTARTMSYLHAARHWHAI